MQGGKAEDPEEGREIPLRQKRLVSSPTAEKAQITFIASAIKEPKMQAPGEGA
jgi:hypothetical protein